MKFTSFSLQLLILAIFLNSCSENQKPEIPESLSKLENISVYKAEEEPQSTIELTEEIVYDDTEDVVIGRVVGVLVDANGRVYIGDYDANKIHVYHSDGSYLTSIGREGEGPGEFRRISQMRISNGLIHVFDQNQKKIEAFSLETFEHVHTALLDFEDERNTDLSEWVVNSFYLLEDGNYLAQFYIPSRPNNLDDEKKQRLYKISTDGSILSDIILELQVGESLVDREIPFIMEAPYSRKARIAISGKNLYKLWTENLAIEKYDVSGEYKSAFYYPVEKSQLDRSQILNMFERQMIRQVIQDAPLPNTWPAVHDFIIDEEGRFWISKTVDDRKVFEWWVLKPNGELISRFNWPRNSSIRQIGTDYLYALNTDDETGEQKIIKYRIKF